MKILVIEDNPIHQEAARTQLVAHEVTIIKSYIEYSSKFHGWVPGYGYGNASLSLSSFDVVLTDMKLLSYDDRKESEADTGFIIAMDALSKKVKLVAILTDANHHQDPMSKAIDSLAYSFSTGNTHVCITNGSIKNNGEKNWKEVLDHLVDIK